MTTHDTGADDDLHLGVGDVARAAGVSVRTLHHYHELGLLRPAQVDPRTGRRRYATRQLRDLSRVVTLKELGFSLREVGDILARDLSEDGMRRLLLTRRAELERRQAEVRHRLVQLDAHLRLLDAAEVGPQVLTREVPALRVAALTAVLADDAERGRRVEDLFARASDLADAAGASRTTPVGRFVPVTDGTVHVLAGFEAVGDVPGLTVAHLPAARVATVVHHGPMDGVGRAVEILDAWAVAHGSSPGTVVRRWHFLEADGEDQGDWVVEVQVELGTGEAVPPR
ncbi:MerR family transcriptional regulator [Cellulomonas telluris]|uniref:MerR family transcriptional regulator n=1 Tax=Cellulomonas telluris TaxID=2306636 RepID=UPI0010A75D14|nr:MerR family transcriptional regulator [Cellulomonas telluris]